MDEVKSDVQTAPPVSLADGDAEMMLSFGMHRGYRQAINDCLQYLAIVAFLFVIYRLRGGRGEF